MKQFFIPTTVLALIVGGIFVLNQPRPPLPELSKLVPFEFEDTENEAFTQENLKGKFSLWTFFFTSCEGPCPTLQATMARLQKKLSTVKDLEIVSLSIDPETDTLDKLREYRNKLGGDPKNWRMLRPAVGKSRVDEFAAQAFHLGVETGAQIHTTRIALVDRAGTVRALYESNDSDALKKLESDLEYLSR